MPSGLMPGVIYISTIITGRGYHTLFNMHTRVSVNFVRARQLCYRTFNSTFGNTDALRVLFDERLCQNWLSRDQCDVPKTFQNVRNDHLAVLINL